MYKYIYVYTYIYINMYIYTYIHTHMYTYVYIIHIRVLKPTNMIQPNENNENIEKNLHTDKPGILLSIRVTKMKVAHVCSIHGCVHRCVECQNILRIQKIVFYCMTLYEYSPILHAHVCSMYGCANKCVGCEKVVCILHHGIVCVFSHPTHTRLWHPQLRTQV